MDDVKEIIQSHPDVKAFDVNDAAYMMEVFMRNMMGTFVDFENGKAAFDSPEYAELLDFVKSLSDGSAGSWQERALLSGQEISRFTDLQMIGAMLVGKYTCIGYPSPDRTPDCIICGRGAYAISAISQSKESAWKFIEWTFSAQENVTAGGMITRGGLPVRTEVYEEELSVAMDTEVGNRGIRFYRQDIP